MKARLDIDKIAKDLAAERRWKAAATGGYFGPMQLLADIEARFRVPITGGWPRDPAWTERRLVPIAPQTLKRLVEIAAKVREHSGVKLGPMQLAALLIEKMVEQLSEEEAEELARPKRRASP
jgi:hypothetical protein